MSMQAGKQEADKVQAGPIGVAGLIITVVMVATYIGAMRLTKYQGAVNQPQPESTAAVAHTSTMPNGEQVKNSPVPQFGMLHQTLFGTVSDAADLKEVAAERLNSYGWVDKQKGTAHIPIARAMELVVQQRQSGQK